MPFDSEGIDDSIALCMSGGGYRAALYHVGSIMRLNEVGLLKQIGRISSVSGGSITSGVLATRWPSLVFDAAGICTNLNEQFTLPIRSFCSNTLDGWAIAKGAVSPFRTAADYVMESCRDNLGLGVPLKSLTDEGPRFVFNSTNLMTGSTFRFSKKYCGDYRLGLINTSPFDVATAVGCSSAFPPVLSPVELKVDPTLFERTVGADLFDKVSFKENLSLADGGVYDNLGLETAWKRCRTVLVSDAGKPFSMDDSVAHLWPTQLTRVMDIALNQALALRKRVLVADFEAGDRKGCYWGINTPIHRYPVADPMQVSDEWVTKLSGIRTRLDSFSEDEQCRLINWGYASCDASLRSFVVPPTPPGSSPYPTFSIR